MYRRKKKAADEPSAQVANRSRTELRNHNPTRPRSTGSADEEITSPKRARESKEVLNTSRTVPSSSGRSRREPVENKPRAKPTPTPEHVNGRGLDRPGPKRTRDASPNENELDSPPVSKRSNRLTKTKSQSKPPVNGDSSEDEIPLSQDGFQKTPLANSTQLSVKDRPRPNSLQKLPRSIMKPYFEEALLMCGYRLGKGKDRNIIDREQPAFLLKFEKEIQKNGRAEKNVDEFLKGFETYISELLNFHKALDPTDTEYDSAADKKAEPCLIRLMLTVDSIQPKLMNILFEQLIGVICIGSRQDDASFELVQKILRAMRFLDRLIDGPVACKQLLSMIELADSVHVKRELILFIPDVIGDAEHEDAASLLGDMLAGNPTVTPAILGSLENLMMSTEVRDEVVTRVLNLLDRAPVDQQHTIMKFLTTVAADMGPVVREIRSNIVLDPAQPSEGVIFAGNLKEAVLTSKTFVDTWLEVVTNLNKTTLLAVDIVALLVFHQNSLERKKAEVVNAIKQHARLGLEADRAVSQAMPVIVSVVELHMDSTLTIAATLLRSNDTSVSRHATIWFCLLVEHLQGTLSQQVINELLGFVGSGTSSQVSLALDILFDAGRKKIQSIAPYAHQLYGLLDKMDEWDLAQVRQVLRLLCMLAYSCNQAMFLQDDLIMLVRKQLSSSNIMWRTRGIIGAISAVSHMNSVDGMELLRHAFNVFKDARVEGCGLFYDELATLVDNCDGPDEKLEWLYTMVADKFADTLAVDLDANRHLGRPCFELNEPEENSVCVSLLMDAENRAVLPVLCPLVRLLCLLVYKKTGGMGDIDAVLGAPVLLPNVDYEAFETLSEETQRDGLDALFYCVNLFRELVNGFGVDDSHVEMLLQRLENIVELERDIARYLGMVRDYTPPQTQFYYTARAPNLARAKPKGKGKAGKKTIKKGSQKSKEDDANDTNEDKSVATQLTDLSLYEQFLRPLELRIFMVICRPLKIGPESEHVPKSISLKLMELILSDNLNKLNYFLVKKRNPFTGKESSVLKYATMTPKTTAEIATVSTKMLPFLRAKLTMTGDYCLNLINENDGILDSLAMFGPEATEIKLCYTLILQNILAIASWPGYHSMRNKALLTKLMTSIGRTQDQAADSTQSDAFTFFRKQYRSILHITAADTLVKLIRTLLSFSPEVSARKTKYLHELCKEFLTRRWTDLRGTPESGQAYNRQIESILSVYLDTLPGDDKLRQATQLIAAIEVEALTMDRRDDVLESFPAITKANFDIVYRSLFCALIDVAKLGATLAEWQTLADAYESLTNILKKEQFQLRPYKLAFAKYTSPFVKSFLARGFPIVEKHLRSQSAEVNNLLRTLQGSTRFAQNLIYDGKKLRDNSLVSFAPMMRLVLEKFIIRVKSALTGENCGKAFYCGNLRNKDLSGELIATQSQSTVSGSQEASDNEDDQDITHADDSDGSDRVSSQSVMF